MTGSERERHDRFLKLYLEHEEALRGFVRSLVMGREEAREVMQEVASVLWRKFEALESETEFRRWAFGVARFEVLAFQRDRARERVTFSDELLAQLADEAEVLSDELESERAALEKCLRKLPEAQRALLGAAYERTARMDELAARLGRTAMSLYKQLHRIRLSLAECVRRELSREGLT